MANVAQAWRDQQTIDADREAQAWASLRAERDRVLRACDWIMLPDAPVPAGTTLQQWEQYRQAWRDITEQTGAPYDVTRPKPPSDVLE